MSSLGDFQHSAGLSYEQSDMALKWDLLQTQGQMADF